MSIDSLDKSYSKTILLFLLEKEKAYKTDFKSIISSWGTLEKILGYLQKDGLLTIEETVEQRRMLRIVLTPKGRAVAEQLKKADEIARGNVPENGIFSDEQILLINLMDHEKSDFSSIKEKYSYSAIDKLKNLGLIEQGIDSKSYPQKSFVNITEKGKKVAKHLQEVEELMEGK